MSERSNDATQAVNHATPTNDPQQTPAETELGSDSPSRRPASGRAAQLGDVWTRTRSGARPYARRAVHGARRILSQLRNR